MMVSNYMFLLYQDQSANSIVRLDPARIAAMTITGIGFLGAGTIIQSKEIVRGLTTAACLWIIAAVGLAVGCGFYLPAITTCIVALVALYLLHYLEGFLKKDWYRRVSITTDGSVNFTSIEKVLADNNINILKVGLDVNLPSQESTYQIDIKMKKNLADFTLVHELAKITGLKRVQWI